MTGVAFLCCRSFRRHGRESGGGRKEYLSGTVEWVFEFEGLGGI
jgi:hypothetical protein